MRPAEKEQRRGLVAWLLRKSLRVSAGIAGGVSEAGAPAFRTHVPFMHLQQESPGRTISVARETSLEQGESECVRREEGNE